VNLRVLTITPFYPHEGDEVSGCFVAEALRPLGDYGVSSSVIAVDSLHHSRKKSSRTHPAEWIRYPQLPGNFGLSSAGRFLAEVVFPRVRQMHRESPISVIHAHAALPCGDAAALLERRTGIPFVVTVHGLDVFNQCFENGTVARWRQKASLRVYRSAAKVICVSDKVRQILLAGAGTGVAATVVNNGTDTDLFSPTPDLPHSAPDGSPTILAVGNLLEGKGHELVLMALRRLQESFPSLQVNIIGHGADQYRFAQLAEDLGVRDRVSFLGRKSRIEVAEAMRHCTVFALPSRNEGLGCVYLEAMACGKPVIACNGQGIESIIQHGCNGWLIPPDGLEELVEGLRTLLENAALREQIGRAARQTIVDRLTLSHQARQLLEIYREAAG
jgi:glycosyltransferase involved in cell wall biosynthesis